VEREISILGCHAFSSELGDAVLMLETYPDVFAQLIGPMISLEQVPTIYDQISLGHADDIKTLIKIDNE